MLNSLNFKSGKIVDSNFRIEKNKSLESQSHLLNDEMLRVEYPNGIILDVDWFASNPPDIKSGFFQVVVQKEEGSSYKVLLSRSTTKLETLEKYIVEAIEFAERKFKEKS